MITRRKFLMLSGGALATPFLGCGGSEGGLDGFGFFLAALHASFLTTDADQAGVAVRIGTAPGLDVRTRQTGMAQPAGSALLEGRIGLAGISLQTFDESGNAAGTVFYRNASGDLAPGLTATTSHGGFAVFNVPLARTLLRPTAGANGGIYVPAAPGRILFFDPTVIAGTPLILAHTGTTRDGAGAAEPAVTLRMLGQGTSTTSDGTGAFAFTVPSSSQAYYRLTKSGFLDTYTLLETGTTNFAADLQVFSAAERDDVSFKPPAVAVDAAKGIVHGIVRGVGGAPEAGATVSAPGGTVVYSDAGGSADGALVATTASGEFTVFNVDPGSVHVTAAAAGLRRTIPVEVFAGSITIVPSALRLQAAAAPTVTVSGTTTDLDGSAIGGVTVSAAGFGSVVSDSAGAFAFSGLPANARLLLLASRQS